MLRLNPAKPETAVPTVPTVAAPPVPTAMVDPLDARIEARIEAYLDRMEAAMTAVPPQERAERRRELRHHLDATRAALEELGETPESAVTAALLRLGEPKTIARHFNRAWMQTEKGVESPWPAMRLGLRWFGTGLAAFMASSVLAAWCGHPLWDETRWSFVGLVVAPCLLGMTLGARVPHRAGMGTFYALAMITLTSLALIVLAPSSVAFSLALPAGGVFACWIPLGSLSAAASSFAVRTHQARRRFRTS